MPELAALFMSGFVLNWIFASAIIFREARIEASVKMRRLQDNLEKIDLRFANSQDEIVLRVGEKPPSQVRTLMFLAIFCSALSWLGFLFHVIIVISIEKLAHKQRRALFASPLVHKAHDASEIRTILNNISESYRALA